MFDAGAVKPYRGQTLLYILHDKRRWIYKRDDSI